jgi:integrase
MTFAAHFMKHPQFQQGSIRLRRRARSPAVWEFRYRTDNPDGTRTEKSMYVGTTAEYPTENEVRARLAGFVLSLNVGCLSRGSVTVGQLIDRFIEEEKMRQIEKGALDGPGLLHYGTVHGYLSVFKCHLRPRWGETALTDVRPGAVQAWLDALPVAPKTKAHIRGLMRRLFEKAMLWDLYDIARNPMELVKVKGVTKRTRMPVVLTPATFRAILAVLPEPYRRMALLAQGTGLRISEILGLQWGDFDFARGVFTVTRASVHGRVNTVKTEYARDVLPLDPELAAALLTWRERAVANPDNWVFANPRTRKPYHSKILERFVASIEKDLGIRIGWHTFRHTYRSWLDATGAPVGVQQKLMRHAQISTTMNIYGNALMDSKRDANRKVVRLLMEEERPGAPTAEHS